MSTLSISHPFLSVQAPITFPTSTPLPDTRSPPSHTHTLSNSPLTKSSSSPKHFPAGGKLDFGLIKSELLSANDKKKALLLQALRWVSRNILYRWPMQCYTSYIVIHVYLYIIYYNILHVQRLTRSLTSDQRSSVMSDYITNDLLGCTVRDSYHVRQENYPYSILPCFGSKFFFKYGACIHQCL